MANRKFEFYVLRILSDSAYKGIDGLSVAEVWQRLGWRKWLLTPSVWLTMYRLEQRGTIWSEWIEGSFPRRRVYHLIGHQPS